MPIGREASRKDIVGDVVFRIEKSKWCDFLRVSHWYRLMTGLIDGEEVLLVGGFDVQIVVGCQ